MSNARAAAALWGRIRPKKKKAVGGRRKSLKRLVSEKEMRNLNLDFLPEKLGFPSAPALISFRTDLDFLHRAAQPTLFDQAISTLNFRNP
jgi:hypothetical protein